MNSFKLKSILIILILIPISGLIAAPQPPVVVVKNVPKTTSSQVLSSTKKEIKDIKSEDSDSLSPDKVILNFENADVQSVIKAISKLSGKNFVIDPRVKGTVNIVSDKPISKVDSYKVLESALRMQGFASVEADGVIKVLPEAEVKSYGMRTTDNIRNDLKTSLGDQVITKVFVIKHGSAMQLANALRPLVSSNSSISNYTTSNAIVVTDYASNITRISKIIDQLSTDSLSIQQTPVVIPLKHAIAADMAQTLQAYLQGGSGGSIGGGGGYGSNDGAAVTITVDPITNSIILSSVVKDKLEEIKTLAISLDKNVGDTNSNMHVVYMKNADAVHVAEVLRVVATNQENTDLTASSILAKFNSEPTSSLQQGSGSGGGSGGLTAQSNNKSSSNSKPSGLQGQKDQPKVVIQAEPTTNSIIIIAPESIYQNLRMVIQMLDIRRAQIMIEAMIADMNTFTAGTFGIQWIVGGGNNSGGAGVISNYGNPALVNTGAAIAGATTGGAAAGAGAAAANVLSSIPQEVFIGVFTGTVSIGGQNIPGLAALADMISQSNAANVISRPTIMTLDNEEARIMVGQNIGVVNGSFVNSANSQAGNQSTYSRQDVGDILQIKPLITQNGAIQLEVWQELSSVENNTVNQSSGPIIDKRNLRSSLIVDDGQIIALGGLTQDTIEITKNAIPLLGDIPYLGWLFSWQHREHKKANLVLFLRPVIVRDAKGSEALTNPRYRYMNELENMVQAKGNAMLPRIDAVNLETQLPFKDKVLTQPNNLVTDLPVVDMRMQSHPELLNKKVNTNEQINIKNTNMGDSIVNLPNSMK